MNKILTHFFRQRKLFMNWKSDREMVHQAERGGGIVDGKIIDAGQIPATAMMLNDVGFMWYEYSNGKYAQ